MSIIETAVQAAGELRDCLSRIEEMDVQRLIDAALSAPKVYFAGAGRSLLALRCVAMRFMHMGIETYVVGDTTTPAFEENDLLIIGSGSGETAGLVNMADKIKKLKGKLALITTRRQSSLGERCDFAIVIPAFTDKVETTAKKPVLPGGTLFEQAMLLLGDTAILALAKAKGIDTEKPFARHANLE
jgi:6-phospho-3-hexuloisomerase